MQSVIMVTDMNCANCAKKIETALLGNNLTYRIDIERKIVVIEGNSDMLRLAKQLISEAGFTVM